MSELAITAAEFETKVKNAKGAVMVDFYADWCGPCKMLAPIVERLAKDYAGKAGVYKVNTDNAHAIATQLGIRGIPTIIFFKDGKEASRVVGSVPYDKLAAELNAIL